MRIEIQSREPEYISRKRTDGERTEWCTAMCIARQFWIGSETTLMHTLCKPSQKIGRPTSC